MWKVILQYVKATFPLVAGFSTSVNSAYSQQNIIADKDNTRPEITAQAATPAKITYFSAIQRNGYNDIKWTALSEQETRRYIVEYSIDGINYQTAGEKVVVNGVYDLKHYTRDTGTFLYRIRMEKKDGRFYNSNVFLMEGSDIPPVKIYPTIVEGNIVNAIIDFPVERINVVSSNGQQVFAKELGEASGTIRVTIPASLNKGMYLMTFYGYGWKTTSKFLIAR
jgi:hypothetical protein